MKATLQTCGYHTPTHLLPFIPNTCPRLPIALLVLTQSTEVQAYHRANFRNVVWNNSVRDSTAAVCNVALKVNLPRAAHISRCVLCADIYLFAVQPDHHRLSAHFAKSSPDGRPFNSLPSFHTALPATDGCSFSSVFPKPLPPDVAKGTMVFPAKS